MSSHQSGWCGHHPMSHRYAIVADMGPLTAFHLSLGPSLTLGRATDGMPSKMGLTRLVQSPLMRFLMTEVELTHLKRNQVICSITALVQGSYFGPNLIATVASEQAWAPGAAMAEASMWRWRLARVGGCRRLALPMLWRV